ncbi:folate-binding protein [Telmatospirillum sp.]|uniref:CAF17-like 4Fe-4S cluster assembly/insertion protein YgfZ n=1 Tax=Telmatospirillum sp. TaxID=2079197 RepID=UPI002845589C|nr:folate-binding protein [Telmatospirillum sp.]MDR3439074.1 folate-binding protein [Telmatospirillum sp.]
MTKTHFVSLDHRALLTITGDDRKTFLQGLVSNDVTKVDPAHALYGAFLTPQGKFLHEFFLAEQTDCLLLETETERRADFVKRLTMYKLRSKISIAAADHLRSFAIVGPDAASAVGLAAEVGAAGPFAGGLALVDPRLPEAGVRAWLPEGAETALAAAGLSPADKSLWDALRISLGLPDGSRDMVPDKAILLENGFDELHGVDWKKGCYLGQELTARTRYRGLIKKRLLPVDIAGPAPESGTPIFLGETEAGEMRSHSGSVGLALIRIEAFDKLGESGDNLQAGPSQLTPHKPAWAVF